MGDTVLNDNKNLKTEKRKISSVENIELKSNELLIRQNSGSNKDNNLESKIDKCNEILDLEEKNQDGIFLEIIETNKLENEVKKFYELINHDSFGDTDSFQTYLNFSNLKNKAIPISMQSNKYTQSLSKSHNFKETDNQIKYISENSQYSPEKKKIKLFADELNFDNKLETSIQTSEEFSCTRSIAEEKFDLINGINLLPNISLNEKTQSNNTFANSAINGNKVKANLSNGNDLVDFTVHGISKPLIENEESIQTSDLKTKPIFKQIEKIDGTNSVEGNESRRESGETNYSGDILILHHEESDIDSEIERCTELLSQNSSEMSLCSKINSDESFQNCNHIDSNDSSEKDVKFQGASLSNSNEDLLLEIESETSNSVDSTQLLKDESDIESEIEKCNELLNPAEVKNCQIIKTDENSQTYDNFFHLENIEKEVEGIKPTPGTIECEINSEFQDSLFRLENIEKEIVDIKPIPGTIKCEINSECQDNLFHLEKIEKEIIDIKPILGTIKCEINSEFQNIIAPNGKSCKKEIKQNLEPENIVVTLKEISDKETKENSEIQNIVTVDDKSPSKETKIDKKILFTKITPQKRRPERIFKLAIKSINEISNENTNSATKMNNDSSDKNNNSISLSKLNCKEVSKDETVVKDYFEDEKDDITNPEWQAVKNLSTNEERYQQVRKCWKSRTVPDPNKNLTYHSYRKRLFQSGSHEERPIRQHKRHASSSLPGREAKRPCTFFLDKEIDSIKRNKDIQKQEIINEMNNKINSECSSREQSLLDWSYFNTRGNNFYHHPLNPIHRVTNITHEYSRIVDTCENSFRNKICALNERRNEVLKFYSFYKGLNDSCDDPTLLTDSQFQELDEIENIYRQFNCYYGDLEN